MKKLVHVSPILLLVFLVTACQSKVQDSNSLNAQVVQEVKKISGPDPYFSGNEKSTFSEGPSSITRNILQDKRGDIWFATWEGIIRYDGTAFTNLTNTEGLRRARAFSLLEDRNGIVWIGTIGAGIYRYDPAEARDGQSGFSNLTMEDGLVNNDIQCMYEDHKGNLWLGTRHGLSCYDGKSFRNFSEADGMPDADINSIIEEEPGKYWMGARGAACIYDGKTFTKITREHGASFLNVRIILRDLQNRIWLGGNDGLWVYEGSSFRKYDPNFVGYLYQDSQGNLWVSRSTPDNIYEMSLYRYLAHDLNSAVAFAAEFASPDGQVFGVIEDTEGKIWYGTERGAVRMD